MISIKDRKEACSLHQDLKENFQVMFSKLHWRRQGLIILYSLIVWVSAFHLHQIWEWIVIYLIISQLLHSISSKIEYFNAFTIGIFEKRSFTFQSSSKWPSLLANILSELNYHFLIFNLYLERCFLTFCIPSECFHLTSTCPRNIKFHYLCWPYLSLLLLDHMALYSFLRYQRWIYHSHTIHFSFSSSLLEIYVKIQCSYISIKFIS